MIQRTGSCVSLASRPRGARRRRWEARATRSERESREVVGRVREKWMDGTEEAHAERSLPDLHVQLPHDPRARELANDERREEVRGELRLPESADRPLTSDRRPEREHDERHVRREEPDEELAPVRQGRRSRPKSVGRRAACGGPRCGPGARGADRRARFTVGPASAAFGEQVGEHLLERGILDLEVDDRKLADGARDDVVHRRGRRPGPRRAALVVLDGRCRPRRSRCSARRPALRSARSRSSPGAVSWTRSSSVPS